MPNLERIKYYAEHPNEYTDRVYRADPDTYTAVPVYQAFREFLGRDPTSEEYAMYQPMVVSLGHGGARSEIAKVAKVEKETPELEEEKRRKEIEEKAPQFYETVGGQFQTNLGRAPSEEERNYFAKQIASGVDPFLVTQALQQLPEYRTKQDEAMRAATRGELEVGQKRYFSEKILPAIQASFVQQGRSIESSPYAGALAQAASQQNRELDTFLANLSASQYGGRTGAAREDFLRQQGQQASLEDYYRSRKNQLRDYYMQRANQLADYDIQRKTYEDFLRKYGKRSSGIGSLVGGGLGALIGGIGAGSVSGGLGAGQGAGLGFGMGSSMGQSLESIWG